MLLPGFVSESVEDSPMAAWFVMVVFAVPVAFTVAEPTIGDGSEAAAIADAVHRAMAGLSKDQQEVVVLRYFVQLSEAQTAAVLGIPAGTVKSRLSRSLAHLSASNHLAEFAGGAR